jgi:basic membrane protein A and related proteins
MEGITAYADDNKLTSKYYDPTAQTSEARLEAIQSAIQNGAKIIVTPGNEFSDAVYEAQDLYPEANFILIDGEAHDSTGSDYKTSQNTTCILFAEEEAGYLAGYSAVKDGYTKLGFIGGEAVPAIIRYGYGFVQGANDAAVEKGIYVEMKYKYAGVSDASSEVQAIAATWYGEGTEVIFGCGGKLTESVISAAKTAGTKAIGTDKDPSDTDSVVVTSAMKEVGTAVQMILEKYYDEKFPGALTTTLTAADNAVGLPIETSRFRTFTAREYENVYEKLAKDYITIPRDTDVASADLITLTNVMVSIR